MVSWAQILDLDQLQFEFIKLYSDWNSGSNQIDSDWFSTDLHPTIIEMFFSPFQKNIFDSDQFMFGLIRINSVSWIGSVTDFGMSQNNSDLLGLNAYLKLTRGRFKFIDVWRGISVSFIFKFKSPEK